MEDNESLEVDALEEETEAEEPEAEEETAAEEETEAEVETDEEEDTQEEFIDYDRIESIVGANNTSATLDTVLDNLAVTDVLMLILALVLGIMIVKGRS